MCFGFYASKTAKSAIENESQVHMEMSFNSFEI